MTKRLILAVDKKTAALVKETVTISKQLQQAVIDGFKKLKIGELENIEQLNKLFASSEDFVRNRMIDISGGNATVGGMKLNRSKLLDLIELPETAAKYFVFVERSFNEMDDIIDSCKEATGISLRKFMLADGVVVSTDEQKAVIEATGVIYADSQRQIDFYKKIEALIREVYKLNMAGYCEITTPGFKAFWLDSIFVQIDPDTYQLVPNPHYIKENVK